MQDRSAAALILVAVALGASGCRLTPPEPVEREAIRERRVVARGLANPRGVLALEDGTILLAEAGGGDPDLPSGRILRLRDRDGDGAYEGEGEREVILDGQPSINILGRLDVKRDEVFGLADIEAGGGEVLATHADPLEGSRVLRVLPGPVTETARTKGNANAIVHGGTSGRWFAVQSFENALIDLDGGRPIARFAPLTLGQDAVPAALAVEEDGALLVAMFSGQTSGDTGGTGVDFIVGAGMVVRVDPATGKAEKVVEGLTAPIDIALADGGETLLVLEFCDAFLDPLDADTAIGPDAPPVHGGFARESGRLLAIPLDGPHHRTVIASGLDLPTNLCRLADGRILVTEGQGTPGRPIPGRAGPTRIEGRLIEIAAAGREPPIDLPD